MAITFLNTATMVPKFPSWKVGNLAILVDTDQGPLLVDTGLGLHDHENPTRSVRLFRSLFGIPYAPEETAIHQLEKAGISPTDVKHIILTHLHFDHAGGISDFPWAKIHLHKRELESFKKPKSIVHKIAYDRADIAHQPLWVTYQDCSEKWFEFDAIPLPFQPKMYLIPLFGHTGGHCGVVIEDGDSWILQAGDSIPANAEFEITPMWLNNVVLGKHTQRIQKFSQGHPEVRILAGHTYQKINTK